MFFRIAIAKHQSKYCCSEGTESNVERSSTGSEKLHFDELKGLGSSILRVADSC